MKHLITAVAAAGSIALMLGACSTVRSAKSHVQDTWSSITKSDKNNNETKKPENKVDKGELPTADLSAIQTEVMIDKIIFGKWSVAKIGNKTVTGTSADERPYIVFDSTAVNPFILKFYAYNGCNTINGMLSVTPGNSIAKVGDYAATLRFCPDAIYEQDMSNALETVSHYKIEVPGNGNYQMSFYDKAGKQTLVLTRNDLSFADGAWLITNIGQIEVKEDAMPSPMMLVIDITEHNLHGSTGCHVLTGDIVTNPDEPYAISFTNVMTTRMACPNAGLEQQLNAALAKIVKVAQGKKGDTLLLLDSAGNTEIKLKHTNLKLEE